jgi:hypothetical protein
LKQIAAMKNIDLGIASLYKVVQGLPMEEANRALKQELMTSDLPRERGLAEAPSREGLSRAKRPPVSSLKPRLAGARLVPLPTRPAARLTRGILMLALLLSLLDDPKPVPSRIEDVTLYAKLGARAPDGRAPRRGSFVIQGLPATADKENVRGAAARAATSSTSRCASARSRRSERARPGAAATGCGPRNGS